MHNSCDTPILRKVFKNSRPQQWTIIEKDLVDEIIFKIEKPRNRLRLELMARGGMRIGEVLKLRAGDVQNRKLTIHDTKSGNEQEIIFIPQKVADHLKEYIRAKKINAHVRIFPICYEAARTIVRRAGHLVGIHLRPHDLRRYAAPHASRCGVLLEIVSKVILRHSNLATTQMYLGKISDAEAMKWIENMYA